MGRLITRQDDVLKLMDVARKKSLSIWVQGLTPLERKNILLSKGIEDPGKLNDRDKDICMEAFHGETVWPEEVKKLDLNI